jgi:hypothetical protein
VYRGRLGRLTPRLRKGSSLRKAPRTDLFSQRTSSYPAREAAETAAVHELVIQKKKPGLSAGLSIAASMVS